MDQDPSCDPLGDCAGLQCYSEQLEQNTTVIVDKCTDPIVVNVTISNMTAGLFSQSFTETTNTGAILVTISRNATHVYVQVMDPYCTRDSKVLYDLARCNIFFIYLKGW